MRLPRCSCKKGLVLPGHDECRECVGQDPERWIPALATLSGEVYSGIYDKERHSFAPFGNAPSATFSVSYLMACIENLLINENHYSFLTATNGMMIEEM